MELYDENINEKKSKIPMIIGISISVLVIITILIVFGIFYLKDSITTITIAGKKNTQIEKIFYIESIDGKKQLYLPIIKTAEFFGYEGFNGDYFNKSEDKTKCHIITENEIIMFSKDSDNLIKINSDSEIEYITIDKPVFEKNGELYTTIDGIQKAIYIMFSTDENIKNVNILSMDDILQYYATNFQIAEYSTRFSDKKAIFENLLIVYEGEKCGIIEFQNINNVLQYKTILENKYQEIIYLPVSKDFIVKSNGKYGIVTKEAEIKVKYIYDEIRVLDNQHGLYLVKQNNSYGIVDFNGNIVVLPEYKQIGINIDSYKKNGVDSKYILLNEVIPIQNNENLWGLVKLDGQQITEFKYTGFGCTQTSVNNSYPTLIIPSYKTIVAIKDKYYTLVTTDGEQLVPDNTLNSVYMKTDLSTEQNQYFMTYNNNEKVINVEEWLKSQVK